MIPSIIGRTLGHIPPPSSLRSSIQGGLGLVGNVILKTILKFDFRGEIAVELKEFGDN